MRLSLFDMNANHALLEADQSDAELVVLCRMGDRDAFARIVARYQSLICALAYSGVGNLAQSEDLAQETFVAAWRHLADLREPAKLRAWLCEIVRNRIHSLRREQGREPTQAAEALDAAGSHAAPEPSPSALAIQRDEETILWREMENIPELYREPLILFYRQNQSIASVAAALDLSEDAVKQRLSRGRKLLHEQVLAFVEGTLARTNPGPVFTSQVMAALPIATGSAIKTATVATAAAKAATAAKATGILGWLGVLVWPLIVLLAGLYTVMQDSIKSARPKERQKEWIEKTGLGKPLVRVMLILLCFGGIWGASWEEHHQNQDTHISVSDFVPWVLIAVGLIVATVWNSPKPWKIKTFLVLGVKQTVSFAVIVALFFIVQHYPKSTLIFLGLTLAGLIFARLAGLGDPDRLKIAVRAAGWVAYLVLFTTILGGLHHSVLFIGAMVAICLGFIIMHAIFIPRTRPPPDSTA